MVLPNPPLLVRTARVAEVEVRLPINVSLKLLHIGELRAVVRYLKGKEKETGYMAEEWHLRYVGKEAKEIAESGLSLE